MELLIPYIIISTVTCSIAGYMAYRKYSPLVDVVVSKNEYTVLIWYNKYTFLSRNRIECKRVYIRLFKINKGNL